MFPLLDLYLCISNKIEIEKYYQLLLNFEKLWGIHVHIFTNNLENYIKLEDFIKMIKKVNITYSFGDGIFNNEFNNLNIKTCKKLITDKFTSLAVIINKDLLSNYEYIEFINNVSKNEIQLEVYFKLNKKNSCDLEKIVDFCNLKQIKLCIVDIDKRISDNKITGVEYKSLLKNIQNINNRNNVRLSVAECPYLNISNDNFKNTMGGCSAGITSCMINDEGNVVLCYYLNEIIIDNIYNRTLLDIWEKSDIFKKLRDRKNIKGKCSKCQYILNCGGCRAESYYKYGNLFCEDVNCWMP